MLSAFGSLAPAPAAILPQGAGMAAPGADGVKYMPSMAAGFTIDSVKSGFVGRTIPDTMLLAQPRITIANASSALQRELSPERNNRNSFGIGVPVQTTSLLFGRGAGAYIATFARNAQSMQFAQQDLVRAA